MMHCVRASGGITSDCCIHFMQWFQVKIASSLLLSWYDAKRPMSLWRKNFFFLIMLNWSDKSIKCCIFRFYNSKLLYWCRVSDITAAFRVSSRKTHAKFEPVYLSRNNSVELKSPSSYFNKNVTQFR